MRRRKIATRKAAGVGSQEQVRENQWSYQPLGESTVKSWWWVLNTCLYVECANTYSSTPIEIWQPNVCKSWHTLMHTRVHGQRHHVALRGVPSRRSIRGTFTKHSRGSASFRVAARRCSCLQRIRSPRTSVESNLIPWGPG